AGFVDRAAGRGDGQAVDRVVVQGEALDEEVAHLRGIERYRLAGHAFAIAVLAHVARAGLRVVLVDVGAAADPDRDRDDRHVRVGEEVRRNIDGGIDHDAGTGRLGRGC